LSAFYIVICQGCGFFRINIIYNVISNDEAKDDEMGKVCSTHGATRNVCRISLESRKERRLGRPRRRWENNIRMDLREIRWGVMDSIDLAQDRDQWMVLVNTVMNLQVP
jgi:hypothetical protein